MSKIDREVQRAAREKRQLERKKSATERLERRAFLRKIGIGAGGIFLTAAVGSGAYFFIGRDRSPRERISELSRKKYRDYSEFAQTSPVIIDEASRLFSNYMADKTGNTYHPDDLSKMVTVSNERDFTSKVLQSTGCNAMSFLNNTAAVAVYSPESIYVNAEKIFNASRGLNLNPTTQMIGDLIHEYTHLTPKSNDQSPILVDPNILSPIRARGLKGKVALRGFNLIAEYVENSKANMECFGNADTYLSKMEEVTADEVKDRAMASIGFPVGLGYKTELDIYRIHYLNNIPLAEQLKILEFHQYSALEDAISLIQQYTADKSNISRAVAYRNINQRLNMNA